MERIESQAADSKELAKQVLSWIICAKRPLTTSEIQHALAVEVGDSELDKENLPQVEDMVSVCAGLVTVDDESRIIRLVHYTTQEYFERTQSHWFPNTETRITETCVTYLSFDVFESGFCQTDDEFEERLRSNQFFEYASRNWGHHAYKVSTLGQALRQTVIDFLRSKAKVDASIQGLFAIKNYLSHSNYSQNVPRWMTGLHLTAYFGVEAVVKLLLDTGKIDADAKDKDGQTPLSKAALNGHEAVAQLLLETGKVDADAKDNYGRTPLLYAAEKGHEAVVRLLLETGKIDANAKDSYSQTPLSWAALNGHEAVVQLLLETGKIDADAKDSYGRTPLSRAAGIGHEAVVQLLLEQGAELESKDAIGRTPLWWAARHGNRSVELLLATDRVNVDSKDYYNSTPLSIAARIGHRDVLEVLLTRSHSLNVKDNFGRAPLWWARRAGHSYIADLLLEKYKENGITIQEDNLPTSMISAPYDEYSRYCDVCVLSISNKETYYHCNVCSNGDFDICKECFAMKAHCLDQSHTLIKEMIQERALVDTQGI